METEINSLCMVSQKINSSTKRLIRLADLENDIFVPIRRDGEGIDRNILHYPSALDLPDKTIAIFSWKPYFEDGWKQEVNLLNQNWIEIIEKLNYTPQQLVDEIGQGVLWSDGSHDLLLLFEKHSDYCLALYWPQNQMCLVDGIYTSDAKTLGVYNLSVHSIVSCANELKPDTRMYYDHYELGDVHEGVWLFSPEKEIGKIVVKHSKAFAGLSKRLRQTIRRILNDIDSKSVLHDIMQEFSCNLVEAQRYYDKYIHDVEAMIAVDEWDGALFQTLIENDSALSKRMLSSVETYWETTNKEIVENITQLKKEIALKESELLKQKNEITSNKNAIEKFKNLELDVQAKIRERLAQARSEVGTLLTEYSFLLPPKMLGAATLAVPIPEIKDDFLITQVSRKAEQIEEAENLEAAKYNLIINLNEAGISDNKSATELSQFLIAAYCNKANLLIAGVGGPDIATALSAAICHCDPARLTLSQQISQQDTHDIIASADAQIILVPNAFGSESFEKIVSITELLPQKMFIFTIPFSQSLAIEPRGLYQYMLPLFTDFFISDKASRDYIYESAEQAIQEFSVTQKDIVKAKAENISFSSAILVDKRQEMVIASIKACLVKAFKDINVDQVCFRALWMPLSICLGRANELLDETRSLSTLEPEIIEELEKLLERGL
ncbi:MAG: hypothetical protein ABFC94_04625 [Syntrophomonas sp.]